MKTNNDLIEFEASSFDQLRTLRGHLINLLAKFSALALKASHQNYLLVQSRYLLVMCEAYILLRSNGHNQASSGIIRTALEVMFYLDAIHKQPRTILNLAFNEYQEDNKFLNATEGDGATGHGKMRRKQWEDVSRELREEYGVDENPSKKLSIYELAIIGGHKMIFDLHYRNYSKVSHGLLRASIGWTRKFEFWDNPVMCLCLYRGIYVIDKQTGNNMEIDRLKKNIDMMTDVAASIAASG